MTGIKLEGMTIKQYSGRNLYKIPTLLEKWKNEEGYIPSETDIRLLGTKNAHEIAKTSWNTSTLSATKKDMVKVILSYDNSKNHELTKSAEFGLGLINPSERIVNYGINLDINNRWEKLNGRGVYTLKRKDLILNQDLKKEQAINHPLILTKLGHPEYVDEKFARSSDEVAEIISKTFELGKKEHGYDTMYLDNIFQILVIKES
jgi:hypothetical protein